MDADVVVLALSQTFDFSDYLSGKKKEEEQAAAAADADSLGAEPEPAAVGDDAAVAPPAKDAEAAGAVHGADEGRETLPLHSEPPQADSDAAPQTEDQEVRPAGNVVPL